MDCGSITKGFVIDSCAQALPIGGTGTRIMLLNYADVDKENSTVKDGVVSNIALKSGKKGYLYETLENANEASATFSKGTYVSTYDHSVTLRCFVRSTDAKEFVNQMKDARLIAVVENREQDENHFEVYGWDSGLKLTENTYGTTLTDNVALAPVLSTDDTSKETKLPLTFFTTSGAATETAFVALASQS